MLGFKSVLGVAMLVTSALLAACGDKGGTPAAVSEPPPVTSLPDPADAALINFAHTTVLRKGGRDSQFDQETVSHASGAAVACGRFVNSVKSVSGYYMARPGDVQISWSSVRPADWNTPCGTSTAS